MTRTVAWFALALAATAAYAKGDAGALAAATKAVAAQYDGFHRSDAVPGMYAVNAMFAVTSSQTAFGSPGETGVGDLAGALYSGHIEDHAVENQTATVSADGQSMWISFGTREHVIFEDNAGEADYAYRATEVLGKTAKGWEVLGGAWSTAVANAKANMAAQAGKLDKLDEVAEAETGDASVREAFTRLIGAGFDDRAATRPDLVVIGSGPGERTLTGKAIAAAWKSAWVGKTAVGGFVRVGMAPSKTTAWVTANVKVAKTKGKAAYAMPFRVFVVFDKSATGWSVVQLHLAVPPPSK